VKTIAVPLSSGKFSSHFGGAASFALYAVDESARTILDRRDLAPPEHGHGVFPMWLREQGADRILAGGMGPRAISIFAHHGIEVVLGVDGDDPDDLVRRHLAGTLQATGEPCHDHGFHGCGHDHDHSPGQEHGQEHGQGHGQCHSGSREAASGPSVSGG